MLTNVIQCKTIIPAIQNTSPVNFLFITVLGIDHIPGKRGIMLIPATVLLVDSFEYTNKESGDKRKGCTVTVQIGSDPLNYRIATFGSQVDKASALHQGDKIQLEIRPDRNLNPVVRLA